MSAGKLVCNQNCRYVFLPPGHSLVDQKVRPGDFVLCHRRGFISRIIRWGERLRSRNYFWSHAAIVENENYLIEALIRGVKRTPLAEYDNIYCCLVHVDMDRIDRRQAVRFAQNCVGQQYGFLTDLGILLRFLTPGHGLWFGMNGTEICSGLVAQALCRGWDIFPVDPAAISPAELAAYYQIPARVPFAESLRGRILGAPNS